MTPFTLRTATLVALLGALTPAAYAGGLYGNLNLGLAMPSDSDLAMKDGLAPSVSLDKGFAIGGAVGYRLTEQVRLQAELAYQTNEVNTMDLGLARLGMEGDVSSLAFLASGYFDFKNSSPLTPFVGAGLGVAKLELEDVRYTHSLSGTGIEEDETLFAYHLDAGVNYALTSALSLDLKYRYFATADYTLEGDSVPAEFDQADLSYGSHNVYAGLRLNF